MTVIHFKNNITIASGYPSLEDFSKKFYVVKCNPSEVDHVYCHKDGHWQRGTFSDEGYTGYFDSIQEAMSSAQLTEEDILERIES